LLKADLAENLGVRGCDQTIRVCHLGKMQAELDRMFKETGHQNAHFFPFHLFLKQRLRQKKEW
jgi:prolyl-tRNA synthetase